MVQRLQRQRVAPARRPLCHNAGRERTGTHGNRRALLPFAQDQRLGQLADAAAEQNPSNEPSLP